MVWSQLVQDWRQSLSALQTAFPRLETETMSFLSKNRASFVAYLADRHELTTQEAEDALEDFLMFSPALNSTQPVSAVG